MCTVNVRKRYNTSYEHPLCTSPTLIHVGTHRGRAQRGHAGWCNASLHGRLVFYTGEGDRSTADKRCTVNVHKWYKPIPSGSTMATFPFRPRVSLQKLFCARSTKSQRRERRDQVLLGWPQTVRQTASTARNYFAASPCLSSIEGEETPLPALGGAGRWEPLASVLPAHTVPRAGPGPRIAAVRVFVAGVPALSASAEDIA